MIKKLFFLLLLIANLFITNVVFGQVEGDYRSNVTTGNWTTVGSWQYYNGATWVTPSGTSPQGYPGQFSGTGMVTIQSGNTITLDTGSPYPTITIGGLNVLGTLTIVNKNNLTITGSVNIGTGAQFNAGTGNSDSTTILVYGDFTNNGTANFWKSVVVIAGNLYTASTILQNNGDIIVGGNITGTITGSGTGTIYPINTNATVSLTTGSTSADPVGTMPTDNTLLSYIDQVIYGYGGTCSFLITDPVNVVTWSGCNASFTATAPSGSTFQWQINTGSGWTPIGTVTSGSTSTYSLTGVTTSMNSYRYRAVITSGSCTKNGDFAFLDITTLTIPVVTTTQPTCSVSTGSITVTAPVGTGVTYSIDGSIYSNTTGIFSLVVPGTYNVTAKSPSGCVSPSTSALIVPAPVKPTFGAVTQPTCSTATGSFSITNYNAGYTYVFTPSTGVVNTAGAITAPAGSYTVTATLGACTSVASASAVVSAQPATPVQPTFGSVTQPTCLTATGSFTITNTMQVILMYLHHQLAL